MSVARDYLDNLLFNWDGLRCSVPDLEERGHFRTILLALSTLAESVVTHGPDLSSAVKHDYMVNTCSNHLKRRQILHKDGLINEQLTSELGFHLAKHLLFTRRCFLFDTEDVKTTVLRHHEHSLASERD